MDTIIVICSSLFLLTKWLLHCDMWCVGYKPITCSKHVSIYLNYASVFMKSEFLHNVPNISVNIRTRSKTVFYWHFYCMLHWARAFERVVSCHTESKGKVLSRNDKTCSKNMEKWRNFVYQPDWDNYTK